MSGGSFGSGVTVAPAPAPDPLNVLTAPQGTPSPTGNTSNTNSVFRDANDDVWIVDSDGDAIKTNGAKHEPNLIFVNGLDPNSATMFDSVNPPVTHNAALSQNSQYLYVGTDGVTWTWDGSLYQISTPSYVFNVGTRASVYRTMTNDQANNTMLSATTTGLLEFDGLRVDIRKVDNTFYSPTITNVGSPSVTLTYQTLTKQTNQVESAIATVLANGASIQTDADNLVYWSVYTEVVSTNLVVNNDKWYEVEWMAYTIGTTKYCFMSVERKK